MTDNTDYNEEIKQYSGLLDDGDYDIDCNIYDQVEEISNCTVQILRNSVTGKESVGWKQNPPARWKQEKHGSWMYQHCSGCDYINEKKTKYCPECGSKMVNGG